MALSDDAYGTYLAILTQANAERSELDTSYGNTSVPTYPQNAAGKPTGSGSVSNPSQITAEYGFIPPRIYRPYVVGEFGPGIKTKCHFETQATVHGLTSGMEEKDFLITKDETGREWSKLPYNDDDTALAAPGKFGSFASDGVPGSFVTSSDFNFGTGDFCIAQWGQVMASWWQNMHRYTFNQQAIYAYLPALSYSRLNGGDGHHAYIIARKLTDEEILEGVPPEPATITWMVKDGYELLWDNVPQSFFDDEYHMFAFSRKGDVFTLFVDGDPKAQETFTGLEMPYFPPNEDEMWEFQFWFKTFIAV